MKVNEEEAATRHAPFVFMVLHYPAPEHRDELARGMAEMRGAMESLPGCLGVDPPLLTKDGTCLVGYSRWESEDAFWERKSPWDPRRRSRMAKYGRVSGSF
jgi:heme-degrading monooxygenase HmoA